MAIEAFEHATRVDPDFAVAWYALANSYGLVTQVTRVSDAERQHLNSQASGAIDQVTRIMPLGVHRYAFEAGSSVDAGEWANAERQLRKVQEATGEHSLTREQESINPVQAVFLLATDRSQRAVSVLEKQRAIDPLSNTTSLFLGEAYANSGNLAAAITEQDRGMQLENQQSVTKPSALMTALATGDRKLIDKRLALTVGDKSFGIDLNAELQPFLDRPDEALRTLRRLATEKPNPILIGGMALWAAYFGDTKLSLELLHDPSQVALRSNQALTVWRPVMHNVRRDPGFKDLLREMGLVDYWREFGWGEHCKPVGKDDFECT